MVNGDQPKIESAKDLLIKFVVISNSHSNDATSILSYPLRYAYMSIGGPYADRAFFGIMIQ